MFHKHLHSRRQLVAVATLALGASGAAFGDDNSMSVLTGDSYAFFNNLEYRAGRFNVARAREAQPDHAGRAVEGNHPAFSVPRKHWRMSARHPHRRPRPTHRT